MQPLNLKKIINSCPLSAVYKIGFPETAICKESYQHFLQGRATFWTPRPGGMPVILQKSAAELCNAYVFRHYSFQDPLSHSLTGMSLFQSVQRIFPEISLILPCVRTPLQNYISRSQGQPLYMGRCRRYGSQDYHPSFPS